MMKNGSHMRKVHGSHHRHSGEAVRSCCGNHIHEAQVRGMYPDEVSRRVGEDEVQVHGMTGEEVSKPRGEQAYDEELVHDRIDEVVNKSHDEQACEERVHDRIDVVVNKSHDEQACVGQVHDMNGEVVSKHHGELVHGMEQVYGYQAQHSPFQNQNSTRPLNDHRFQDTH